MKINQEANERNLKLIQQLNERYEKEAIKEVLVDGYASPVAGIQTKITEERIEFSSSGFGRLLTNPSVTDNGQTIGERNRAYLHEKLDAWLDKTFEEKNT